MGKAAQIHGTTAQRKEVNQFVQTQDTTTQSNGRRHFQQIQDTAINGGEGQTKLLYIQHSGKRQRVVQIQDTQWERPSKFVTHPGHSSVVELGSELERVKQTQDTTARQTNFYRYGQITMTQQHRERGYTDLNRYGTQQE